MLSRKTWKKCFMESKHEIDGKGTAGERPW